jgi:uncharacterized Ntn-hydrolase superfamily protein
MTKFAIAALLAAATLQAQDDGRSQTVGGTPDPWFGTFSIIAFDPATTELGVAVQSRAFGAGAAVPYAKPGVGAVATQASANRQYGPKAIALLEQGLSPADVVKRITDEDPGRDTRQVAVIDAKGRSAVYTGRRVIERNSDPNDLVHLGGFAGHVTGENFSAQGNTLASAAVVEAMAAAYRGGKGSMAERLMDALDAGQAKGGDTRGMQSAGILVVRPLDPTSQSTVERIVDIRVDDHAEPFKELRRLLYMTTGVPNRLLTHAGELSKAGQHREAIAEARKALEINPRAEANIYGLAKIYAAAGERRLALEQLTLAISRQPKQWKFEAARDPAFEGLRALAEFQRIIKP